MRIWSKFVSVSDTNVACNSLVGSKSERFRFDSVLFASSLDSVFKKSFVPVVVVHSVGFLEILLGL
jgi:hypothetical protein